MVQLFVPEGTFRAVYIKPSTISDHVRAGEGQHALVRRRLPDPVPISSTLLPNLWQGTLYAAGATALLAFAGKSRPGMFLNASAYFGVGGLAATAIDGYGRREVNRAIFKMDNVEPKPGKLWERTKHLSVDDMVIGGGVVGVFLALSPRAFPGAGGWKRFFGAATVGSAVSGYVGERHLGRSSAEIRGMLQMADLMVRATYYTRLRDDEKARASLSRVGKIAFTLYTVPLVGIKFGSASASGGVRGPGPSQLKQGQHHGEIIQYEFNKGELLGPDMENGFRAYKDMLVERDPDALQDWLERLQEVRKATADEASYVWLYLARKEHDFYSLVEENHEKDVLRRELQLLNNMAFDFATRDAIIGYQVADIMKRLRQMEQTDPTMQSSNQDLLALNRALRDELPATWKDRYDPQLLTEQVRIAWTRQKEVLAKLEQSVVMHGELHVEPGSVEETGLKTFKQSTEVMKKNVEATERLLKELEDQVRRADGHVKS
jgi:hypothetical protein